MGVGSCCPRSENPDLEHPIFVGGCKRPTAELDSWDPGFLRHVGRWTGGTDFSACAKDTKRRSRSFGSLRSLRMTTRFVMRSSDSGQTLGLSACPLRRLRPRRAYFC